MDLAVLVPVKSFTTAKQRLTAVLSPSERVDLARWLADHVLDAVAELPVYVACDDPDVREWATGKGATVVWGPGLGLNGAVDDGVAQIALAGFDHVLVTHSDLPRPRRLTSVVRTGVTTLVPDRRSDGTNVMAFPTSDPLSASYGASSFSRHLRAATDDTRDSPRARTVEVRRDTELGLDIDTATDLFHPLIREVLPTWLPTIQANRFTHDTR